MSLTSADFVFDDEVDGDDLYDGGPDETSNLIPAFVTTGLLTRDQLVQRFGNWNANNIGLALSEKAAAELTWDRDTDVDKLEAAFLSLSEDGLLDLSAIDGYDNEYSEWSPEVYVDSTWRFMGGANSGLWAAIYYTWDEVLKAVETGTLRVHVMGFVSACYETKELSAAAARLNAQDVLESFGLKGEWNATEPNVLRVSLSWQRRNMKKPIPSRSAREMSKFVKAIRSGFRLIPPRFEAGL
jgi:hypothetical protein